MIKNLKNYQKKLDSVPIKAVNLRDGFWSSYYEKNRKYGIPAFLAWLDRDDQTAPFRAFYQKRRFNDSSEIRNSLNILKNNYKGNNFHRLPHTWRANFLTWVEACALILQSEEDNELSACLNEFVDGIIEAHNNRNFINIYYGKNYKFSYQLAAPAHLIQAAVSYYRATKKENFLKCAMEVANDILQKFKGEKFAEHPGIEMALVELYRLTGEKHYLKGARHFLEALIRQPAIIGPYGYGKGNWRHFNRHVVRQTYLCAGGSDYFLETGEELFIKKLENIWNDMATAKLQIGGQLAVDQICPERITSHPYALAAGVFGVIRGTVNSGFELCESVGNAFWNWRMFNATGNSRYMDLFEKIIYNGFLAHVSLDGMNFYYLCPMSSDGDHPPRNIWGHPQTNCCPPNALRFIASLPQYFFSTSLEGIWVNLYDNCRLNWKLKNGTPVLLDQETKYPWDGKVTIRLALKKSAEFSLFLRIPGWCRKADVYINNKNFDCVAGGGIYYRIDRRWVDGDCVNLDFMMPPVWMAANPNALEFKDKIALMRGPLVYCFEGTDNPGINVWDIKIKGAYNRDRDLKEKLDMKNLYEPIEEADNFQVEFLSGFLNGVTTLNRLSEDGPLDLTAIPYYAWGNRGPGQMRVWVGLE